jgi:predicted AAA+ superfamily ATPase
MNRNTKRYPKEEINRLKKSGKRLRGGYVLTRLKNWKKRKATAKKVSVDLPATEIVPQKKSIRRPFDRVKRGIKTRQRSKIARERLMYWKGGKKKDTKPNDIVQIERVKPNDIVQIERVKRKKETVSKVKNTGKIVDIVKKDSKPDVLPKSKIEKIERVLPEKKERAKKNDLIVETIKKADEPEATIPSLKSDYGFVENYLYELYNGRKYKQRKGEFIDDVMQVVYNEIDGFNRKVTFSDIFDIIDEFNANLDIANDLYKEKLDKILKNYIIEYLLTTSQTISIGKRVFEANKLSKNILSKIKDTYSNDDYNVTPRAYTEDIVIARPGIKNYISRTKLTSNEFAKIVKKFTGKDELRPALQGIFYEDKNIVLCDSYQLAIIPDEYISDTITNKLVENKINTYGIKNRKDFTIIDEKYPPYKSIIPEKTELLAVLDVDNEMIKVKQFNHWFKYFDDQRRVISKISVDGNYVVLNYKFFGNVIDTFKMLGKKYITMSRKDIDGSNQATFFTSDDITILVMPIRVNKEQIEELEVPFDIKLYNFSNETRDQKAVVPFYENKYLEKTKNVTSFNDNVGLSDNDSQLTLLDDNDPNVNAGEEIKAIASDIPAFGDDIREEQLELDSKLDLPDVQQNRNNMEIASAKDIRTMKFKAITLPSKYRQLLGKVPSNFRLLLWGAPGHGKSSLALTIANDIGKYVKTLYVSAEESLQSATLASRIKRFKATARNLMFNDTNNPEIIEKIILTQNPKFIVIDSVNVMIGKTEAMINLMLKYPEIGFILIAQATKDRKRYAGLGSLAHAVDIVVNVKSGVATAEKNRYSQLGSMPVKGIKI